MFPVNDSEVSCCSLRLGVYREEKEAAASRSDDSDDDGPILYREEEHPDDEEEEEGEARPEMNVSVLGEIEFSSQYPLVLLRGL